ncbi:MAG TPA: PLP-dependent aminotransferase family protein [Herpetosiphonaceae bacterium]|nr:PLP-dependent aminotransferase family protein [Herpetosiphonaceae bacterium]
MTPTQKPSPLHQLSDLYAQRARDLAARVVGAAQQGRAAPISLAFGLADPALFPTRALAAATAEALSEHPDAALNYGPPSRELIEQIATRLRLEGIAAEPDHLMVSYGSGQILALLPQVLVDPGDVVMIEGPSFMVAVRRFELAGARIITVPLDAQGMDVDVLASSLADLARAGIRPKFIYTIPTFHNPAGVTMPLERRKQLVALAAHYGVLIVEDDAYGELRFVGDALPSLAALDREGWVIRIGTYSKILAPGVRVGWAYGPRELLERLSMFRSEGNVGPFLTHVVARYCANGRLEAHIEELRALYRQKCQVMLDAIRREFPPDVQTIAPEGGFFIWCRLPADLRATALLPLAAERGVAFLPGVRCYSNGQGDNAIRLSFSYHDTASLTEGIARLADAMRTLRAEGEVSELGT